MQYRMKTHQLSAEQIEVLLSSELTGVLSTVNDDGTPYAVPVHFIYEDKHIYIHGLPAGKKLDNIRQNSYVCFTVYHMDGLLPDADGKPCDTNTKYQSVIINGDASVIGDNDAKGKILGNIVKKYTPQLADVPLPEKMVRGTAVISVEIREITGKFWE